MEDELFNSIPKIILKNDVLKIRTITDNDGVRPQPQISNQELLREFVKKSKKRACLVWPNQ